MKNQRGNEPAKKRRDTDRESGHNGQSDSAGQFESDSPAKHGGFSEFFRIFSAATAKAMGSKWAFILALTIIAGWAACGPVFHFSDTWQLVINTGTTIVTFLMVFLIQNTQNRDAKAIHLKLDELIRAHHGARNAMVDLEELSDEKLDSMQREFQAMRKKADARLDRVNDERQSRQSVGGAPDASDESLPDEVRSDHPSGRH